MEEYASVFSSLCLQTEGMDDLTKATLFTEGLLDPKVKREVHREHVTSLQSAIRATRTAQEFCVKCCSENSPAYSQYSGELQLVKWKAELKPKLSSEQRQRLFREGRSFRYRQTGHIDAECRKSFLRPRLRP